FIAFPHWCLSPDATLLASIDFWEGLRVRELATGKTVLGLQAQGREFTFVQFSPDGQRVAAVAARRLGQEKKDGLPVVVIRVWDLKTGKEVHTFAPPPGATETFKAHWFQFSPDGAFLAATGDEDDRGGVVRVWDVAGKKPSWLVPGQTAQRDQ